MPAPGDQHRTASIANPFDDTTVEMSKYTAQELATLKSRLEKKLGPEYISSRQGPSGQKVHYLAAEKCIMLANDVFGFNGWSSSIRDIQVDFVDENTTTGKICLGLSVIVRVTLKDGAYHEDIGYGHIENCKGKAAAFEKAKKEGTTDALKRTLRSFGNMLGNCVYDKEYLAKVTKMKVAPTKWDPDTLHRHQDFAPRKGSEVEARKEAADPEAPRQTNGEEAEDEFGVADFDEADFSFGENAHPDEVALESSNERANSPVKQGAALANGLKPGAGRGATAPNPTMGPPNLAMGRGQQPHGPQPPGRSLPNTSGGMLTRANASANAQPRPEPTAAVLSTISKELGDYEHDPAIGFVQARVADKLQSGPDRSVLDTAPFNAQAQTASLRRTQGVDHSTSKPLSRPRHGPPVPAVAAAPVGPNTPSRGSFTHPHLDPERRIGMPPAVASPLQNRGNFKPPAMMKRPAEADAGGRAALSDVTAASANVGSEAAADAKRLKVEGPPGVAPAVNMNGQ